MKIRTAAPFRTDWLPAALFWMGLAAASAALVLPLSAAPETPPASFSTEIVLADLIREALEKNPGIQAALRRAEAAEHAVSQAGAPPDPRLTLGLMNLPAGSFAFDREPMTGKLVSIMQMFPLPGKLALAETMAEHDAAAARLQGEEVRNQIVRMVRTAYYDLYMIDRGVETVKENQFLIEQMVRAAEARYATGSGLQQDVLRAQVEQSRLVDDLLGWRQKRRAAAARLNALLDRPADSPLATVPPDTGLPENDPRPAAWEEIELSRPLVRAWQEKLGRGEAAVRLAEKDFWPNISVGLSYSQRDDLRSGMETADFLSATVSFDIPLFFKRKQKARAAQREIDLRALRADYESIRTEILSEEESLRSEMERSRRRAELYEGGILIQARQSLESAMAGYETGKVDFLTVISGWMMLQNFELQYHGAVADFQKSLARWEAVLGIRIDDFSQEPARPGSNGKDDNKKETAR